MNLVEVAQKFFQDFPAYSEYKDSGVEWLGNIPQHWEAYQLKRISDINYGLAIELDRTETEGTFIISLPNVTKEGQLLLDDVPKTVLSDDDKNNLLLKKGDLLFNWRNGSSDHIGKTAYFNADGEYTHVSFLLRLRFDLTNHDSRYYHLYLNNLRNTGFFTSAKTRVNNTYNQEELKRLEVIVPPFEEQKAISYFFDKANTEIDQIIEQQQELIALLEEDRKALINEAVTKGLNLSVTMKDSGVEWLGEIPAHWEVLSLRRVVKSFVDYRGATPEKVSEGIPLVTAKNIKNGLIDLELSPEFIRTEDYLNWMVRGFPEVGDVLVTTEAPLGETAQITDSNIALAQRIILIKVNKDKVVNKYLKYWFLSVPGHDELYSQATGSTALGIKASKFKAINFILPPLEEQKAIADYIDTETAKIDEAIENIREQIEKIEEYRTALISEAVTGKIDVRELVPKIS